MIPRKIGCSRLYFASMVLVGATVVIPGCGAGDEANRSSTERLPWQTASQDHAEGAPSAAPISVSEKKPVRDSEHLMPTDVAGKSEGRNGEKQDGIDKDESSSQTTPSKQELLATLVKQADPEVIREKMLTEAREAYELDRKRIDETGSKAEAELLSGWDGSLLQARKGSLQSALKDGEAAVESWNSRIVPFLMNDDGKVFANSDHSVIAFIRQTELAGLSKLNAEMEAVRKLLKVLDAYRAGDSVEALFDNADREREKLRTATAACLQASDTILGYMQAAQKRPATAATGPIETLPT